MHAPHVQRAPLCLICASAARWRPQARRLVPFVQTAYRSGGTESRVPDRRDRNDGRGSRSHLVGMSSFNPLRSPHTGHIPLIRQRLEILKEDMAQPEFLDSLRMDRETFDQEWLTFERSINLWIKRASSESSVLFQNASKGRTYLDDRLRYLFYAQACSGRFTKAELDNQKKVADLRYPEEWYPATREIPRAVHLHVGPTNSGKTYHALKRLEEADRGIYLGPLRLLAHEVYTRLNAKGKPCALVTGEEQRIPEGETKMWSCTVEMAPLNTPLDVAVIDEIQMINHKERGWAWTQAFLGVQAREIHLCGEARTVPLMRELCALVGDKLHVHEYERLTPLKVADRSLGGKLKSLQKGDCIVAFSVLGLHALRREIEQKTGRKCAIVYGSLPPETRAQQARLFNDPDSDYDFLVASDAIGMGLNLSIKRVIFESTMKSDGIRLVPLQIPEIKQIAGRAGRYRTAHQDITEESSAEETVEPSRDPTIGLDDVKPEQPKVKKRAEDPAVGMVTTLEQLDFNYLKMAMSREPPPIKTAGLFPPSLIVERFASYFPPGTPFSYIMLRLHEISVIHPRFHLCALKDSLAIADAIHTIKDLSIADRITICAAPTNMRGKGEKEFLRALATCIADNKSGELLDLPDLPLEVLDREPTPDRAYLYELEQLHKMLTTYLWLSYRFPNVFTTRSLANHTKKLVEDAIERTLMQFSFTPKAKAAIKKMRMETMRELQGKEEEEANTEAEPRESPVAQAEEDPAEQVLHDTQSFDSGAPPTDDEGEYPMPEFEVIQPETLRKIDSLHRQHHRRTQELSSEAHNLLKGRMDPNIKVGLGQPEPSQARA